MYGVLSGTANMCGRQLVAACLCQHACNGVYIYK